MLLSKSHHFLIFACGNPSRTQPWSLALCGSLFFSVRQRKSLFLLWRWQKLSLFSWPSKMAECLPLDYQNSTGTKAPGSLSEQTGMVLMCSPLSSLLPPSQQVRTFWNPFKASVLEVCLQGDISSDSSSKKRKGSILACPWPASLLNPAMRSPEHALLTLL